jgi:quercetin dioxygenase-like cupin family protein
MVMAKARYSKLQREPVLERRLPNANPPVRLIKAARIRFAPGQPSGLHRHPISTCGVITEGTFIFQIDGEAEQHLKTGDGFFEPACATIRRFDNASENEPAEIVCFYLADSAETPAIEMLEGGVDAQLGKSQKVHKD